MIKLCFLFAYSTCTIKWSGVMRWKRFVVCDSVEGKTVPISPIVIRGEHRTAKIISTVWRS